MIACISGCLQEELQGEIERAECISLIADESCDIAIFKKLAIYCKIVIDGKVEILFCHNQDIANGQANTIALQEFIDDFNIPRHKLAERNGEGYCQIGHVLR